MPEHGPFKPKGERARWRVVYDLLRQTPVGQVLTYDHVAQALALDSRGDRSVIHAAFKKAAQELLTQDKRAVHVERGVGYRIAAAEQHVELARERQRRAAREIEIGHATVSNVNMNELSEEGRRLALATVQALSRQADFMQRLDVRQQDLENAVQAVAVRQDRTDEQVQELKERMAWLEQQRAPQPPQQPSPPMPQPQQPAPYQQSAPQSEQVFFQPPQPGQVPGGGAGALPRYSG